MRIEVTDAALKELASIGFDPIYGARPLKRAIRKYLQHPLADNILGGEI